MPASSSPRGANPAGIRAHADWLLAQLRAGAAELSEAELLDHIRLEGAQPAHVLDAVRRLGQGLRDVELMAQEEVAPGRVVLTFGGARPARLTLDAGDSTPPVVTRMWIGRAPPPDVRVRPARSEDYAALHEIEASTPRTAGAAERIERDDTWHTGSLVPDTAVFVADADGAIAGLVALAPNRVRVGGVDRDVLYLHRARVLPSFQRRGVGSALVDAALAHAADRRASGLYWYMAVDNEVAHAFAGAGAPGWRAKPEVLLLRCARLASHEQFGEPSSEPDTPLLAEILNESHRGEEMYLPYDEDSLRARLSRSPDQYGWPHLWRSGASVIGVRGGAPARVWRGQASESVSTTRAYVLRQRRAAVGHHGPGEAEADHQRRRDRAGDEHLVWLQPSQVGHLEDEPRAAAVASGAGTRPLDPQPDRTHLVRPFALDRAIRDQTFRKANPAEIVHSTAPFVAEALSNSAASE
jgi:ribosomal protein S18 acetylase RimI-like enzyme